MRKESNTHQTQIPKPLTFSKFGWFLNSRELKQTSKNKTHLQKPKTLTFLEIGWLLNSQEPELNSQKENLVAETWKIKVNPRFQKSRVELPSYKAKRFLNKQNTTLSETAISENSELREKRSFEDEVRKEQEKHELWN